ncbi:MAG TPA: MltA domain-containing protein [Casimicrobiaceae bacterium]|nr:MltA domain-containing protein [Casimicrobiaceae bacterium]
MIACAIAFGACTSAPRDEARPTFVRVDWRNLTGYATDRLHEAWPAFIVGCKALVARATTALIWTPPCTAAQSVDGRDERAVRGFFENHFSPYKIVDAAGSDHGLVTGYYEARLAGSREKATGFGVPLYARPADLLTIDIGDLHPELAGRRVRGRSDGSRVVSYWPRADIVRGKAPPESRALAWLADPLDAFFLEVQGSGRIVLADGTVMRVGYADQNGHPYRAIGRVLVERGEMKLEEVSLQSIRAWAQRHPERVAALLDENPSYVFFRELPAPPEGSLEASINGPIGSLGVPLLAQRTIAVDGSIVPLGAPVWLATSMTQNNEALQRLVMAQDTGGAIRGAVRADYFFGFGEEAMQRAGTMRQQGRMWLLWPQGAALPDPRKPSAPR